MTGQQKKSTPKAPTYTSVFADSLIAQAEADKRIVAVTAAMAQGTGLDKFQKRFPRRFFDVGIAEQHGVTFCAGMAAAGLRPFCAIYSTFLQRGYDQIVHDVALQGLPVRFAIDRAGLVGEDGATHAGAFDIAYLANLPGFVVMAASDEAELVHMVATAAEIDDAPVGLPLPARRGVRRGAAGNTAFRWRSARAGSCARAPRSRCCRSAAGWTNAARRRSNWRRAGLSTTIADARFAKPLDTDLILQLVRHHQVVITIEEGAVGGFGGHVLQYLAGAGGLDRGARLRTMTLPDRFIDHDTPKAMYEDAGLCAAHIVATALDALGIGTAQARSPANFAGR